MDYGLWISAAGLQANGYRQDVLANNLANADTTGFKRDLTVFSERQVASAESFDDPSLSDPLLDRMTGGLFVSPTYMSFEQGPLQQTNRPLDVALMGEGFLAVRDGDRTVYTRDGALAINAQGELVMASGGREVLSEADAPIRVPDGRAGEVRIAEDGRVMLGNAEIARLHLVNFADKQSLVKLGSNLYAAGDQAATATAATLQPGALERSTVDPTTTMVAMIEASRAYQLNAQMISMQDTILGRAVNDIATIE